MSTSSALRSSDFRLLVLGQAASQFGAQMGAVALPLLAVLTLRASPLEVGLIAASSTVAFLLIGLPAGVWIDRVRRKPVLVTADLVRAGVLAAVAVAAVMDVLTVPQLVAVGLVTGFARVFFDLAYQSFLPAVVGRDQVLAGNSAVETLRATSQFVGPGLGGWLTTTVGAAFVVAAQAVTFLVSAVSVAAMRTDEGVRIPPSAGGGGRHSRLVDGFTIIWNSRPLRAVAVASAVSNLAFAVAAPVTILFLARVLHLSPTVIGLVVGSGSVTVMLGAALTPRLSAVLGSSRIIWLALAATGPAALLVPLAEPGRLGTAAIVGGLAVGEFGQIIYAISSLSLRQRLCPDQYLGRVTGTMRFLIMGAFPLGSLLGGALGEAAGVRAPLWLAAVLMVLSPVPLYLALRGSRDVDELVPPPLAGPPTGSSSPPGCTGALRTIGSSGEPGKEVR